MARPRVLALASALSLVAAAVAGCSGAHQPSDVAAPAAPAASAPAPSSPPRAVGTAKAPSAPLSYVDFERNTVLSQVPAGWTRNQQAPDHTDFRDPTGQLLLRLGEIDPNKFGATRPDAYLRQLAARAAQTYPKYKQVKFSGMTGGPGIYPYAEWEFTFVKDGVTRRVIEAAVSGRQDGRGSFCEVYYSAPVEYFPIGVDAYTQAVDGLDLLS